MFDVNGFVSQSGNPATIRPCCVASIRRSARRHGEEPSRLGAVLSLSLSNRSSHRGRDVPTAAIFPFGKLELGLHPPTLTV